MLIPEEESCDIIGKDEKGVCDCDPEHLTEKAMEIFETRDLKKIGEFTFEMIDNCVRSPQQVVVKPKKKRKLSAWNLFVQERMKGCGKDKPCAERLKEIAVQWKEKKKREKKLEQEE